MKLHTEASLSCYRAYLEAQELREAIDNALNAQGPGLNGATREAWEALRGAGAPVDPDVAYGSIYEVAPDEETVVGLQHKLLFVLNLLQAADERPTPQALEAVRKLRQTLPVLKRRWEQVSLHR